MKVLGESIYEDGNYSNLLTHFGLKFTVHFVKGEIRVHDLNGPYRRIKHGYLQSSIKAAREFTKRRIMEQGAAFIEAHKALYEVSTVAL